MPTDSIPRIPSSVMIPRQVRALNDAIDTINSRRPVSGAGASVGGSPLGSPISLLDTPPRDYTFYGVVVNVGPGGDADFTDQRYWVRSIVFGLAAGAGGNDKVSSYVDWSWKAQWIIASHVGEIVAGTHGLPVLSSPTDLTIPLVPSASIVKVQQAECGAWIFETVNASADVIVKITSSASGGGKYNGRILTLPTTDVSLSGNLALADFGVDPGSDNAIIVNLQEVTQSTHDLMDAANTYQLYFRGKIVRSNSDGTRVVAINGIFIGC